MTAVEEIKKWPTVVILVNTALYKLHHNHIFLLFNRGHTDEITINIFLLYYIKQRDPMLPWIFSVMNHGRGQNVVRTSVIYSAVSCKQGFCFSIFWHHLWSTSAQVQDNIESACWIHITEMRPFKDDFCSGCVW